MQKFFIGWNIAHRRAVMDEAHISFFIHNTIQRHSTQFEEVDFLTIHLRDRMIGVGQADKWDALILPIAFEFRFSGWTHGENLRAARGKLRISIAQARQRRAAIRSHKTAQEVQHDRLAAKLR